ncbi:MAG: UDP-3-O-acyl-N-acetylglucosamine deacetylase [Planctomycetota bacterium]
MQHTIKKEVSFEGIGLFSGQPVKILFRPAPVNTGLVFIRTDLPEQPHIPATTEYLRSDYRRTALEKNGASIETIEHLLAALSGLGINNLEIELNASEVPGGDGSAKFFIETLTSAELLPQDAPSKIFAVKTPVAFSEGEASLVALPTDDEELIIDYTLQYAAPIIGTTHLNIRINPENFVKELAPSRTFCLKSEVDHFLNQGLGKGASYQNVLVVDNDKVIQNQLRFKDEFVRHKILDLLGDLYLLGVRLQGHIIAVKTGHEDNVKFVKRLADAMQKVKIPSSSEPKIKTWLDVRELQNILPHRYPFLLIDKIIEMEGYNRAVGIKNVTINEPFFMGHFPGQPVMPGVLQLEAMAQLAATLLLRRAGNENKLGVLLSINNAKFRKSVVPGDQLRIEAETIKSKSRTAEVYARALVDGELASEASIKFMLVDKE